MPPREPALNPELQRLLELCNMDRAWVRGAGLWLYDERGQAFLDCYAQYGALALGHNPPELVAALREVLDAGAPAMTQPYRAPYAVELAERLAELSGLDRCVFTTSGAETVEAALKLVRMRSGRPLVLSCHGSYHGKTLGALSLSGQARYQADLGPGAAGFLKLPFGDATALERALEQHKGRVAALFLEPIQGERGVILPPPGYLCAARELCDRHGAALVLDEIQTGLGRTGRMFCFEHDNVRPDILLLSKALGGGLFPLGACLVGAEFWDSRFALNHSATFANHNLACRVGLAFLEHVTRADFLPRVVVAGERLLAGLQDLARRYPGQVAEARGRGLLCALQLRPAGADAGLFRSYLEHQGLYAYGMAALLADQARLLVLPALGDSHVLRLAPPLIAGDAELDQLLVGLDQVLGLLEQRAGEPLARAMAGLDRAPPGVSLKSAPISLPPLPRSPGAEPGYAFLIHYTRPEDIVLTDPALGRLSQRELRDYARYIAQVPPGVVYEAPLLRSPGGGSSKGWLIALGMLPEAMFRRGRAQVGAEIRRAVDLAAELGARIVGLGAFTSVFSRRGLDVTGRGPAITTGNLLTAGMAFAAVERVLARRGQDLAGMTVGVVGARGSVGALCAKLLARAGPAALRLVGNPASGPRPLQKLAEELAQYTDAPIRISIDLNELRDCQVILSATSAGRPILDGAPLRPGTLICDVARPRDASETLRRRPDLTVIDGGLVALPDPTLRFGAGNIQGFPDGVQLACLSETILLALAGDFRDHGLGEDVPLAEVDRIMALAGVHGFRLAEPAVGRIEFPS